MTKQQTNTLGDALPAEMKRIREVVIPAYQSIGAPGRFGLTMINAELTQAEKALESGEVVTMIAAYASLEEIQG